MYKHDCVKCLRLHYFKCLYGISFLDRFFGTDKVKYCPKYLELMEKKIK